MDTDFVLVMTTFPAAGDAAAFASALIDARVAACVNLLPPMESVYRWQGKIEREAERQILIKTTRERLPALRERIRELHPYEVPELIVLPIAGGSDEYLGWIAESTR